MSKCIVEKSKLLLSNVENVISDNVMNELTPAELEKYEQLLSKVERERESINTVRSKAIEKEKNKVTNVQEKANQEWAKVDKLNEFIDKLEVELEKNPQNDKAKKALKGFREKRKNAVLVAELAENDVRLQKEELSLRVFELNYSADTARADLREKKAYKEFLALHSKYQFREMQVAQKALEKDKKKLAQLDEGIAELQAKEELSEKDSEWLARDVAAATELRKKVTEAETVNLIKKDLSREGLFEDFITDTGTQDALSYLQDFKEVLGFSLNVSSMKEGIHKEHLESILDNDLWKSMRHWNTRGKVGGSIGMRVKKGIKTGDGATFLTAEEVLDTFSTVPTVFDLPEKELLDTNANTPRGEIADLYINSFKPRLEAVLANYKEHILKANAEGAMGNIAGDTRGKYPALSFLFDLKEDGDTVDVVINDNAGLAFVVGVIEGFANSTEGVYTTSTLRDEYGELLVTEGTDIGTVGSAVAKEVMRNLGIRESESETAKGRVSTQLETSFSSLGVAMLVETGFLRDPTKFVLKSTGKEYDISRLFRKDVNGKEVVLSLPQSLVTYKEAWDSIKDRTLNPHLKVNLSDVVIKASEGNKGVLSSAVVTKYAKSPRNVDTRQRLNTLRDFSTLAEAAYGTSEGRNPSFPGREPVLPKPKVQKFDRDVPPVQLQATTILSQQAMQFNSGISELMMAFEEDEGKDTLKRKLGWKPENEIAGLNLSQDDREKIIGKSIQIDNIVEDLYEYFQEYGTDFVGFQEWFTAKQDRLHVKNTSMNYMEDKNLIRWLYSPEAWMKDPKTGKAYTRNKQAIQDLLSNQGNEEAYLSMDQEDWFFVNSLVQAFEGTTIVENGKEIEVQGVDKEHPDYTLRIAKVLLDTPIKDLKEIAFGVNASPEHIGHAALAIANIKRYQASSGDFESDLYGEVDGKTNGVFHRLYQFGSPEFLEKFGPMVGVSIGEEYKGQTLRERHGKDATSRSDDVYTTVGKSFVAMMNAILSDQRLKFLEGSVSAMSAEEVQDMSNEVWSKVRAGVKDPTMISMYGAGLVSLYNKFLSNTAKSIARRVINGEKLEGVDPKLQQAILLEVRERTVDALLADPSSSLSELFLPMTQSEDGFIQSNFVFGAFINPFFDNFKDQFELNDTTTTITNTIFKYVSELIQQDINKLSDEGKINKHNVKTVIENYKQYLPNVEQFGYGVDVEVRDDKLYFYKTKGAPEDNAIDTKGNPEDVSVYVSDLSMSSAPARDAVRGIKVPPLDRVTLVAPGASAGPLQVHSLDSNNLSLTVIEAFAEFGSAPMPMHDAIILPPHMVKAIRSFNRVGHEINTSFSYLENFQKSAMNSINFIRSRGLEPVYVEFGQAVPIEVAVEKMYTEGNEKNTETKKLLLKAEQEGNLTIAQMDGLPGSAYVAGEGESASFSTEEQRINLLSMLNDPEKFEELIKTHKERLNAGIDTSLWATANSIAGLVSEKTVATSENIIEKQYNSKTYDEVAGLLNTIGNKPAAKNKLASILREILGSKEKDFDKLVKEFTEGCK